jgi:hypothetical protein
MLTIGLTSAQTAGLTSIPLVCPSAALLVGFPNCSASIANAVIAISAADGSNTTYSKTSTLFDSGTPDMILAPPNDVTLPTTTGTNVLANNEKVLVTLPNSYEFSYSTTPTGVDETVVIVTGTGRNIVGIDFFKNHD